MKRLAVLTPAALCVVVHAVSYLTTPALGIVIALACAWPLFVLTFLANLLAIDTEHRQRLMAEEPKPQPHGWITLGLGLIAAATMVWAGFEPHPFDAWTQRVGCGVSALVAWQLAMAGGMALWAIDLRKLAEKEPQKSEPS